MTGFLSLPREIRDLIYEHSLVKDEPIHFYYPGICRYAEAPSGYRTYFDYVPELTFSIFGVSKSVYHEASRIFYSHNHFEMRDAEALRIFQETIGQNADYMRHLHFGLQGLYYSLGELENHPRGASRRRLVMYDFGALTNGLIRFTNLQTITLTGLLTYRYSYRSTDEYYKEVIKDLDSALTHFQAIPSAKKLIIKPGNKALHMLDDHLISELERRGCTVTRVDEGWTVYCIVTKELALTASLNG